MTGTLLLSAIAIYYLNLQWWWWIILIIIICIDMYVGGIKSINSSIIVEQLNELNSRIRGLTDEVGQIKNNIEDIKDNMEEIKNNTEK